MKRIVWRAGVTALVLAVAATAADADSLSKKRKKSFFSSLFMSSSEQKVVKQRKELFRKQRKSGSLFGSSWDQPSADGVRIIKGGSAITGEMNIARKNRSVDDGDPEPEPGLGMGNLTYVPDKLVSLDNAALRQPRPAGSLEAAIYDTLAGQSAGIKVLQAERDAIVASYEGSGFRPLWVVEGKPSARATEVLKLLADAGLEGLDPATYLPPVLTSYADASALSDGDVNRLAQFDLGLTAMVLKYARESYGGRFDPKRLSAYNDITAESLQPDQALRVIAFSPFVTAYLQGLQPKHPAYAVMKTALGNILNQDEGFEPVNIPAGTRVKIGKADARVPALRERLKQLGFAGVDAAPGTDPNLLDQALSDTLKEFQQNNNLKPSGQLETQTVNALNGMGTEREKQKLLDNMERLRWLPKTIASRYVFVNQAAFRVDVMDSGKPVWTSKVIVGKPMTQTAVFNDQIETVVFNPSWGVPSSIIANEYLPKLRRDPSYLDRIGFSVVDSRGRKISSRAADWWSYGNKPPYSIQQPPGQKNALGELKFLFPNAHDIYMHDTPSRNLFAETVRAFSHGCVRVQNPREFATVLLGWDRAKVDKTTDSKQSQSVPLPEKVPVQLTYFTAWPDENGNIQYFADIYGRDQAMENARSAVTVASR